MGKVLNEELLAKYTPDRVEIKEFNTKIVGTTFRKPEEVALVEDGDFVLVEAEIGNVHDSYAVRVVHDDTGNHIGYMPASDFSKEVWENSVKNGHLFVGRVTKTGGGTKQVGYNLRVRQLIPKAN